MSITVERSIGIEATLTTAMSRLIPGDGVRLIRFTADADVWLVYSTSSADGDAVPASARMLIPQGTVYPIPINHRRVFVCATVGTVLANLIGESAADQRGGRGASGGGGGVSLGMVEGLLSRMNY